MRPLDKCRLYVQSQQYAWIAFSAQDLRLLRETDTLVRSFVRHAIHDKVFNVVCEAMDMTFRRIPSPMGLP